jgi:hypothetical protein
VHSRKVVPQKGTNSFGGKVVFAYINHALSPLFGTTRCKIQENASSGSFSKPKVFEKDAEKVDIPNA